VRHPRTHWLFQQIQEWQAARVISDYQAEAIRNRYVSQAFTMGRKSLAAIIWSVLGAFSLILGVVLVIANEWPSLMRYTRLAITVIPILGSWVAMAVMVWKKKDTVVWRESVACTNLLAMVVALALVCQMYNIQGSTGLFFVTVIACSIPVMLVTRSLGWMIGTGLMINVALVDSDGLALRAGIALLATGMLVVPDTVFRRSNDWLRLALGWCVTLGFTAAMIWMSEALHPSAFMILPAIVWSTIIGLGGYSTKPWAVRVPMISVAVAGLFVTLFLGSFPTIWDEWVRTSVVETPIFITILGAMLGLQLSLFLMFKTHWFRWCLLAPSGVFLLGMIIYKFLPIWVFPMVYLGILVGFLTAAVRYGVIVHRRWWINAGLVGFVLIMLAKFFGADLPMGIRAAGFLVSGGVLIGIGYRLNQWTWQKK